MSENRAPAQHCPYCGETDLWPHEASHGAWSCRDCRRVFAVKFLGIAGGDPAHAPAGSFPDPDVVDPDMPAARPVESTLR